MKSCKRVSIFLLMSMFFTLLLTIPRVVLATQLIQISGSGTWSSLSSSVSTIWGSTGGSWSFSFDLPATLSSNPTTQATNFEFNNNSNFSIENNNFTYNGTTYPGGVTFWTSGSPESYFSVPVFVPNNTTSFPDGLVFGLTSSSTTGESLLSGLTLNTSLGSLSTFLSLDDNLGTGNGFITLTPLNNGGGGGLSATPEPPTFWLMATGILGMFGWVGLRRIKISV